MFLPDFKNILYFVFILAVSFFCLYVFKLILEEKGWTENKIENYFRSRRFDENEYNQQQSDPNGTKESKGEAHARKIASEIFQKPFEKLRPDFLRNNVTGKNLEMDLFNEDLNLAIEVQGAQHYRYIPFFHKNYEAFLNQKYRDEMKKGLLDKANINLIEIPYTVKLKDYETYIRLEARKLGYDV
jgi:hypothetical protein